MPRNGENEIFWKNPKMSLPYPYNAATLCKKLEQTYERILRSKMHERTDEHTDGGEFKGPDRLRRGTKNGTMTIKNVKKLAN